MFMEMASLVEINLSGDSLQIEIAYFRRSKLTVEGGNCSGEGIRKVF